MLAMKGVQGGQEKDTLEVLPSLTSLPVERVLSAALNAKGPPLGDENGPLLQPKGRLQSRCTLR